MKRRTTTQKLHDAIKNNMLKAVKAEVHNKTTHKVEVLDPGAFMEDFDFFCESGIFMSCLGWYFEEDITENDQYIAECGRKEGGSNVIVTAFLRVYDGVDVEEVEEIIKVEEE